MKRVLYIGTFGFLDTAPGLRVNQMGKLYQKKGYEVQFLRLNAEPNCEECVEIGGFHYDVVSRFSGKKIIWNLFDLYTGQISLYHAKHVISSYHPDIVILYNDVGYLTKYLLPYCHKRNIILGADVTEWYEVSRAAKWDRHIAKMVNKRILYLDEKLDFIVAISPYLKNYYVKKKCRVFMVPPLMDKVESKPRDHFVYADCASLNIGYAGSPKQKDSIQPFVSAIEEINKSSIRVHLDLVGISKECVEDWLTTTPYEKSGIRAYGRLPRKETLDVLHNSDYTILFRDNLRYAKAGFSTKFAESMSLGIPVICNRVGGADMLLEGSDAGILLPNQEIPTLIHCINALLVEPDQKHRDRKKAALELASNIFLSDNYV